MTFSGSTEVTSPEVGEKPCGWFIHEFTATTEKAPPSPGITIGTPHQKWGHGARRLQPKMEIATKIASRKKKIPSIANKTPNTGPKRPVNAGQRSPNSNDRTVPVTAPTAKVTATAFDQRCASFSASASLRRSPR